MEAMEAMEDPWRDIQGPSRHLAGEEHFDLLFVRKGSFPGFYLRYVKEV